MTAVANGNIPLTTAAWLDGTVCSASVLRSGHPKTTPVVAPKSGHQAARGGSGARVDLWDGKDINPATVPEVAITDHLDRYGIDIAILTGGPYSAAVHPDVDYAAAYCRAFNLWTEQEWTAKDTRFRASIHIAPTDPEQAAAEIDRLGEHPAFVQVLMPAGARMPFGNRFYHPIYAAAERHGLPICIHFGAEGAGVSAPPTARVVSICREKVVCSRVGLTALNADHLIGLANTVAVPLFALRRSNSNA